MVPRPELHFVDADQALASWRTFFVLIWRNRTTVEGVRRASAELEAFARKHPHGVAMLTIVEADAPMPTTEARTTLGDMLRRAEESLRCSALAFEGDGFRAAAIRSVVTGLALVARPSYPHKVFDSVRSAVEWLAPKAPSVAEETHPVDLVVAGIDEIRRLVAAR